MTTDPPPPPEQPSSATPTASSAATPSTAAPPSTPAPDRKAEAQRERDAAKAEKERAKQQRALAADRRRMALRRFTGLNFGAAFFGWLVGVGVAVLLTSIVAAAGAALSLTQESTDTSGVTRLSASGVVLLAIILLVAYYCGGYVAGRLSRFSGAIQGVGVWVIGLVVTAGLAIAGAIAGSKYNVLAQLRLPTIPVNGQSFATGGAIALVIMAVLTLLAAIVGAFVGLQYHRRVDRVLRDTTPPTA